MKRVTVVPSPFFAITGVLERGSVRRCSVGFTLVELVVVLMLTGILAVAVLPKFVGLQAFDDRGFHDSTLAALRYAQKAAIAQRHTVCVTFTATTITAKIASAVPPSTTCDTDLAGPNGTSPYTITARGSSAFASVPTAFNFSALGRASTGQTIQVANVTSSITVEAETGYVHE
jgi:MSHA pilin protein MshC